MLNGKHKTKPSGITNQPNRATLPLTADTKEMTECMCPNLSNMNYNNGSDMNATNVVTDLSNIPNNQGHHHHHHQHYDSDQMRFEALSSPMTDINNSSNSNNTTNNTTTTQTTAVAASMVTANNSTNNSNGDAISNNEMTSSTSPPDGPLRHSSMDRLMSLLNEMGQTPRTRSISDGGQDEGKSMKKKEKSAIQPTTKLIKFFFRLFPFCMCRSRKRDSTGYFK